MSGAINTVLTQLDEAIRTYVFSGYAELARAIDTPLNLALTAYIAFIGWSTTQHWSPFTTGMAVKHVMKIILVVMIATHWDFFSTEIYTVVTDGPNQLANILVGSSGHDIEAGNQALQSVFDKGIEKGNAVWKEGGSLSMGYYIAAILIYGFNFLSTGFALLEISVAKCGLGIALALAPVFACFLLWEGGKGIFEGWMRTIFGFALVPLILTSVMMLMLPILNTGLDAIHPKSMENGMGCLAAFILGSFSCIGLLLKSAQMAAVIGGGIGVSSLEVAGNLSSSLRSTGGFTKGVGSLTRGSYGVGKKAGKAAGRAGRWMKQKMRNQS